MTKFSTPKDRAKFLSKIQNAGTFITPNITIEECRDPKDNKFLELAVAGNADCIVTGDKDLLVLNPFRSIPIITAGEFICQL